MSVRDDFNRITKHSFRDADQLRRSVHSIGMNITEGYGGSTVASELGFTRWLWGLLEKLVTGTRATRTCCRAISRSENATYSAASYGYSRSQSHRNATAHLKWGWETQRSVDGPWDSSEQIASQVVAQISQFRS